jgi:periplasmic divalent cation tolerance protein
MENDCVVVWTTIGRSADGRGLASILVNERLAACVNVLPEMESIYRWKGQVETDSERQVVIKTTVARVAALRTRLHELHDYDVPEFIVLPIAGGSEAYLNWIRESTAG